MFRGSINKYSSTCTVGNKSNINSSFSRGQMSSSRFPRIFSLVVNSIILYFVVDMVHLPGSRLVSC